MPKTEQKLLEWIDRKKEILFVLVLAGMGLLLRFPLRNIVEGKNPEKILATGCDLLLAVSAAVMVALFSEENVWRKRKAVIAFAVVLFSPELFFSSAVFGYGESLLAIFLLWTIVLFLKEQYLAALCLLGLAMALDLQAMALLPFVIFVYLYHKRLPLWQVLAAGLLAGVLRVADHGLGGSMLRWYTRPEQAEKALYAGNVSLWTFLEGDTVRFDLYAVAAVVTAFLALLFLGIWSFGIPKVTVKEKGIFLAFLFCVLGSFFWPAAGEGTAYFAALLALVLVFFYPCTLLPAVLLNMIGIVLRAATLYGENWLPMGQQALTLLEAGILLVYFRYFAHTAKKTDFENERKNV